MGKSGEQINELVRQIECSGSVPDDLPFLVSKPHVTGTQEHVGNFFQQTHASIISSEFKGDCQDVIHKMNNFYQNSTQSDDCELAKGGLKESEASVLQGTIAKLNSDMDQLKVSEKTNNNNTNNDHGGSNGGRSHNQRKCCTFGSTDHVKPDCP